MPSLHPHREEHFTAGALVRDIVIGMSDGLTVPFALAAREGSGWDLQQGSPPKWRSTARTPRRWRDREASWSAAVLRRFGATPGNPQTNRFFSDFPKSLGLIAALLGLVSAQVQARPVHTRTPDQLAEKAAIICNATPLSLSRGEKRVSESFHFQAATARFKVIGVSKGDLRVGKEIELHFTAFDNSAYPNGFGGLPPLKMGFEMGKRYRLYLNPAKGHSWYVGALDGEFDDNFAEQMLEPGEGDESAPVFEAEAIQLASGYYRKVAPSVKINPDHPRRIEASYSDFSQVWTVRFWARPPIAYPDFTSDAEILVGGSRDIREKESWIAEDCPFPGKKLASRHIGASLRITVDRLPERGGNRYIVWGNLLGLSTDEIQGHFYSLERRDFPIAAIPRESILGVQILKKPPSF